MHKSRIDQLKFAKKNILIEQRIGKKIIFTNETKTNLSYFDGGVYIC